MKQDLRIIPNQKIKRVILHHVKLISCLVFSHACEKTRRIELFYSKISASNLFIYYRRRKRTLFIYFNFKIQLKDIKEYILNNEFQSLLSEVCVYVIFPMLA